MKNYQEEFKCNLYALFDPFISNDIIGLFKNSLKFF